MPFNPYKLLAISLICFLVFVDRQWFETIADYIGKNNLSFTYWCWNPNSGDMGGILRDDWQTIHENKQAVLNPLIAPLFYSIKWECNEMPVGGFVIKYIVTDKEESITKKHIGDIMVNQGWKPPVTGQMGIGDVYLLSPFFYLLNWHCQRWLF